MTARCSVFVGASLDGFIARSDGSIDWLQPAYTGAPPDEDFGFARFMATVDALVMGRTTFEQILTFDEWPYGATPVVVMSRTLSALPAGTPATVSLSHEAPADLVARLSAEGARHLYIDGGRTIQSFLAAGLIDDLTITVLPILLGAGRPLFGPLPADVHLTHIATQVYDCGFVQHTYRAKAGQSGSTARVKAT